MPYFDVLWSDDEDGNVEHIAEHGLSPEDVEFVLQNPVDEGTSESSGRPIVFGYTPDGRYICVVYEKIDDMTLCPITAFEIEED
jgi:uncharacterized DUF497 family protein